MAQLYVTLNQEEILQLLSKDHDAAFRELLTQSLNSILKAESQEQLKAEPYERSEERTDSRNGVRARDLKTRIGRITLSVPRHRNQPFKTMLFENYTRSESALIASMAEIVKRRAVVGTNGELKSAVLCSRRHARVGNGAFSAA